jgi:N-acetyl sugar amidotransferase
VSADYRVCSRCVMDTTDPDIRFDAGGVCNHCHDYERRVREEVFTGEKGRQRLQTIVDEITREGAGNPYDCVIGVSGGVDSTFVAYKVKQLGLRPLAVHLDNGWDSELAVNNIHKTLETLGIDLYTHVIDWEEFRDLQVAFLKASTPDSEIPSDHAIVSLLYKMAEKTNVRYVIIGRNVRTETHVAPAWSMGHFDWKYIRSIHEQFGTVPLNTFPYRTRLQEVRYREKQRWISILNYVDYVKKDAMSILQREIGFSYYGSKHYESIYTRFFQGYILPKKFGYDKRKGHFSSLICSGEMTRADALNELKKPPYPLDMQEADRVYVIKKLGLTEDEFERIMKLPKKTIFDYPSYARDDRRLLNRILRRVYKAYRRWGRTPSA